MKRAYLLLPPDVLRNPQSHRELASAVVAGFQALWHPALLADAEGLPAFHEPSPLPEYDDFLACIPKAVLESLESSERATVEALGQCRGGLAETPERVSENPADTADSTQPRLLIVPADARDPEAVLGTRPLAAGDAELLRDFFAFAFAHLGLQVLFTQMGQDDPVDDLTVWNEIHAAATAWRNGDNDTCRGRLQAAFDLLTNARQLVFPATINLLDLALVPPSLTATDVAARLRWRAPVNVMLHGSDVERLSAEGSIIEALRAALDDQRLEIVGGPYDARPWSLLSLETRAWQLERSAAAFQKHLGRTVDCFGSRTLALTPDLPQLLMKHQYRYALHMTFDGATIPYFRDAKLHWTATDGSVIETLARTARDGSQERDALTFFAALAQTLNQDRGPVLVVARWLSSVAPWLEWLLRGYEYAAVFGQFQTIGDYFLNSSLPEQSTKTRTEEYGSVAAAAAVAKAESDPIGRWVKFHEQRGRLEAARSLLALERSTTAAHDTPTPPTSDVESALEGGADVVGQLADLEQHARDRLAALALDGAPAAPGYLLWNPSNIARRACLELPDISPEIAVEAPLRAVQAGREKTAVVVDVPGWGFAWIPRRPSANRSDTSSSAPLASGRRLRNEYIEVEIDPRSGGIRALWDTRSRYSRLGQQLVHGNGSRMVVAKQKITATGPAFGEIASRGEVLSADGKTRLAHYRQRVRVWRLKPVVELSVTLDEVANVGGDPSVNYLACRWAWPDEKTVFLPASGFTLQNHRQPTVEAPHLVEIKERHLTTTIVPFGLPFHHRMNARMADTLLVVAGESRREFRFEIGLDLAQPWAAAYEVFWPTLVIPVDRGPPLKGRSGWLAQLNAPNVVCSSLVPVADSPAGVRLRMAETHGKPIRAELRFARNPTVARLTNFRGDLLFDLYPVADAIPVDFGSHELQQVEAEFAKRPEPPSEVDPYETSD